MADLSTQTTHTLTLTTAELAALRRGLIVAEAATKDDPKAAKDRAEWKRLSRVGKGALRGEEAEETPPSPRPTLWGTGTPRPVQTPG